MWITVNPEYWCPQQSRARPRRLFFCANSANHKSFLGTYVLTRHSGKQRCIQSRARLSGVITDSGSSLPLPTTKNSGDWHMRRCSACSRHLEHKTTRNMAHITWRVRLQRAQRCANDMPDHRPSTPYQQTHLMNDTCWSTSSNDFNMNSTSLNCSIFLIVFRIPTHLIL